MSFEPGSRLGTYEILAPVGSTGEAYTASDTRLNRKVVLKMLPPEVSQAPEMTARVKREIEAIASLKHPHISAPLDIAEGGASHFLVTEQIEGEPLADRLTRGPLNIDEALKVAIAIADALDKAHRQGVVHRGLTPFSVLLTPSGPKILDFGLARPKQETAAAGSGSFAMTRTALGVTGGVQLSAAPYTAPEQFEGAEADARTDVFAFGAMLYELVTGRKAFEGKTLALVIASVQSLDPDPITTLQPMAPPALDHVLKRCLSKDPKQRLQTAWDLLVQLQWIAEGGSQVGIAAPVAARRQQRDRITWIALAAAAFVVAAVAATSAVSYFRTVPDPDVVKFVVNTVGLGPQVPIAMSPDGRWIIGSKGGAVARGVDAVLLNSVTPQVLIPDNVVTQAFWSPDSRSIGFFEDNKLKKADVAGGPAQTICETPPPIAGGSWNSDGVIVFSSGGAIHRVVAAGGQPAKILEPDPSKQETEFLTPFFLPDGRHFVFLAVSSQQGGSAVYVASLDSTERTRLFASESRPIYAAAGPSTSSGPGYLLFNRSNTVFAQPFDARTRATTGEAIRVADGVPMYTAGPNTSGFLSRGAIFAASQTGTLIYRSGATATAGATGIDEQRSLVWLDRTGSRVGQVETSGTYAGIDLSPDSKRYAVHRHEGNGGDTWVFDTAQNRMQRLTFDATQDNQGPLWSPDGARIVFASRRNNKWGLYLKSADGTGTEELITESDVVKAPFSWSPDGKVLLYFQSSGSADIWAVPLTGDRKPFPVLNSPANEQFAQISPDGKWLAYQSNETGRNEIYVKQFPDGPGKWQVSTEGGQFVRWRGDGKELYFAVVPNMMAVEIRVAGSSIQPGVPKILFGLPGNPSAAINHLPYHRFAVTADGQRFLVSQPGAGGPAVSGGLSATIASLADRGGSAAGPSSVPQAITVVLNWPQALKKK
jgi:Tol biopolymer transport system component/tRNA A-37 threonylcarbamoyl transferase component Bud32